MGLEDLGLVVGSFDLDLHYWSLGACDPCRSCIPAPPDHEGLQFLALAELDYHVVLGIHPLPDNSSAPTRVVVVKSQSGDVTGKARSPRQSGRCLDAS
jgi:hypothetical protein